MSILAVVAALLIAEIALTVAHAFQHGWPRRHELADIRISRVEHLLRPEAEKKQWEDTQLVLHPLFGYTWNPRLEKVNNIGFRCRHDVTLSDTGYTLAGRNSEDVLCVGIFGGSFADFTARHGDILETVLKESFPNLEPVVRNCGCAGYALPLTAYVYLYYRDLLDVVVFIDGLNECWNYITNNEYGFPPDYAKASHYTYKVSREKITPEIFTHMAMIVSLREKTGRLTRVSLLPLLKQSILVHTIWENLQGAWQYQIELSSKAIVETYKAGGKLYALTDEQIYDYAADQWARHHRLIHRESARDGDLSIHIIQPNPYYPNEKVLTDEEENLVRISFPVETYVVKGYPKLMSHIAELRTDGLIAEDFTGVFDGEKESMWMDSAHANEEGVRIILRRIADLIKQNKDAIGKLPTADRTPIAAAVQH